MEQKWSDRFNLLEALLLAKSLDREPTFSAVKVTPTHTPPASAICSEPFLKPSDQPSSSHPSHHPAPSASPATDPAGTATASKAGSDSSRPSHQPGTSDVTVQPTAKRQFAAAFDSTRKDTSSSESDSESFSSDRPPVDLYPEEGELSDDHEVSFTDPNQSLSEEQSYRETMRGIRSYMG